MGADLSVAPTTAVNAADYEAHARRALDDAAWAYLAGGAGDELTLRANRDAWSALCLVPRVLRALAGGHTRVELLGRTWPTPLLVAPVAHQKLAHPDGEWATAMAAGAQGAGFVLSTQTSVPLEQVAATVRDDAGRGPLWFQLYWQHDRGVTRDLVQRAEAAGFEALVLTVDAPVHGARDRERRAGFRVPAEAAAVHLRDLPPRPARARPVGGSALFDDLLVDAPTWRDVEWLRGQTRLPLVLKGVLHPDDAR